MRKGSVKNNRINAEVQKEISSILQNELKDPRVDPMTSVIDCDVTPDLKYCKVFVSVMGNEEARKKTMEGLNASAPFFRRRLAQTVNLRNTPEIRFVLDDGIEYGMNLSKLIEEVKRADDAVIASRGESTDAAGDENGPEQDPEDAEESDGADETA